MQLLTDIANKLRHMFIKIEVTIKSYSNIANFEWLPTDRIYSYVQINGVADVNSQYSITNIIR